MCAGNQSSLQFTNHTQIPKKENVLFQVALLGEMRVYRSRFSRVCIFGTYLGYYY